MRSARALETAPTWSQSSWRSRMMLMKRAAPAELAAIIGSAMTSTSARASGRGRATARMMAIWVASASTVVAKATHGLKTSSERPRRTRWRWTIPPMSPSVSVESPQARPVKPPSHQRWSPPVSPTAAPSHGPPMRPARMGPMARVLAMAPRTGKPR